jgi:hypothetical protein
MLAMKKIVSIMIGNSQCFSQVERLSYSKVCVYNLMVTCVNFSQIRLQRAYLQGIQSADNYTLQHVPLGIHIPILNHLRDSLRMNVSLWLWLSSRLL